MPPHSSKCLGAINVTFFFSRDLLLRFGQGSSCVNEDTFPSVFVQTQVHLCWVTHCFFINITMSKQWVCCHSERNFHSNCRVSIVDWYQKGLNYSSAFLQCGISIFSPCMCGCSPPRNHEHYVVCTRGASSSSPDSSGWNNTLFFSSSNHQPSFQTASFKWRWVIPVGVFSQALGNMCKELQFLCNKSFEHGWELFTS